jgi:hypothetical protein
MKKLLSRWMVMISAAVLLSVFTINTSQAQGRVSLQVFYDELDPYGTWMEHRTYGYVWIPSVDRGFVPYSTNGYWVQTEYGNTWVSDYSWGWAPFHYGRWFYDDFYGWIWVPDSEWAPAWVTWRNGGGYYGWAPLMPGLSVNVSVNYYNSIPNHYWVFVPHRYILHRHFHRYYVPRPQVVTVYRQTTIITNNYNYGRRSTFFTGPSRREIERTNRERVEVYSVNDRNRPGRTEIERGRVSVYRPEVDNSRESRSRSVPSRIARDERDSRGRESNFERREAPAERRTTDIRRQREDADRMDQRRTTEQMRRAPENNREINRPSDRTNTVERQQRQQVDERIERNNQVEREQLNRRQEVERVQRTQQIEREQNRERTEREQSNRRQEVEREQGNRQRQVERQPQRNVEQQRQPRQQIERPAQRQEVQRAPNRPQRTIEPRRQPTRNEPRNNERRRN